MLAQKIREMKKILPIFFFCLIFWGSSLLSHITFESNALDQKTKQLTFYFELPEKDFMYKDYLRFWADSPDVHLSQWHSSIEPIDFYDPLFKETKKIFNRSFVITLHAMCNTNSCDDTYIHVTFFQHSQKKIATALFALRNSSIPNTAWASKKQDANPPMQAIVLKTHNQLVEPAILTDYLSQLHAQGGLKLILFLLLLLILMAVSFFYKIVVLTVSILFYLIYVLAPFHITSWFFAVCALCTGIYLLVIPLKQQDRKWYTTLMGMLLIAGSIIGFLKAYSFTYLYRVQDKIMKKI